MRKKTFTLILGLVLFFGSISSVLAQCSSSGDVGNISCTDTSAPYNRYYSRCVAKDFVLWTSYGWESGYSCGDGRICKDNSCMADNCVNQYGSGTRCIYEGYCALSAQKGHADNCRTAAQICCKGNWQNYGCWDNGDCNSCEKCDLYQGGSKCIADSSKDVNGTSGACGLANGGNYCSAPVSGLCSRGSAGSVTDQGSYFSWYCYGTNGTCAGSDGSNAFCTATDQPTTTPVNGQCGSVDGDIVSSKPSSNLCTYGNESSVSTSGTTYTWTCSGIDGKCPTTNASNDSCSATQDSAPRITDLALMNTNSSTEIVADGSNRNQICQFNSRVVKMVVTASDTQGTSDIRSISIQINGTAYSPVSFSGGVATFNIDFSDITNGTHTIYVKADDDHIGANSSLTTGWDAWRNFKNWDCKVPISGVIYDGSASPVCPNYSSSIASNANFTSLRFKQVGQEIYYNTVVNESAVSYTSSSGQGLIWGSNSYSAQFNSDLGMASLNMRLNGTNCGANLNAFSINNIVDPYAASPSLTADFSGVVDQENWFQAQGGGVIGRQAVTDDIPITCTSATGCTNAISISNSSSNNGVVAAYSDTNSCGLNTSNCKFGSPKNWKLKTDLNPKAYDYDYFFNQYHQKFGQGATLASGNAQFEDVLNLGGTGVVFVDGNLNIATNNTLPLNQFLMVIVKGNITITPQVTQLAGIFVGQNISVGGTSTSAFTLNGLLYSPTGNISFTRSFSLKSQNNTKPAVIINYRPDLIFNLPGKLAKLISGWKQGI